MKTVIEMAHEVGFGGTASEFYMKALERFVDLIRADERDRAMRENSYVQLEREACAKACEELFDMEDDSCNEAEQCAEAIRARSNK